MQSRTAILLALLFTILCNAQTESAKDSSDNDYKNEVQFYIYKDVIAAYKYNISRSSSLRFRVNLTGLFNNTESDDIRYNNPSTNTPEDHRKYFTTDSDHFFEINLHYLYFIKPNPVISLYFGAGPFVNYDNMRIEDKLEEYSDENILTYAIYRKTKNDTWNLGVSLLAGIECTLYKNINLFAEYEAAFSRGWQTRNYYSPNPSYYSHIEKYYLWNYDLKGIRLGAGIYF